MTNTSIVPVLQIPADNTTCTICPTGTVKVPNSDSAANAACV